MTHNKSLKERAIALRMGGLSYSEILREIPIAKSTLAIWLQSVNLSKNQTQRLTERKRQAQLRGALARKNTRIQNTKKIFNEAKKDIPSIIKDPFWVSGILLYWAEGSKQKEYNPSSTMRFSNSDQKMIRLFLKWSKKYLNLKSDDFIFDLYIHRTGNLEKSLIFWANIVNCKKDDIHVYFKKHKPKTTRKNVGENYHGLIRINLRKSTNLYRKVDAWISHLCEYCGIV
ncbi:MAG: hypothetical protein WC842_00770 [Candidatus Paceibacterota bacterium]